MFPDPRPEELHPDPGMQMTLSAVKKQEIEEITENQEGALSRTPDRRKRVSEKIGVPQVTAKRKETVSRKVETPRATTKQKETVSRKSETPRTTPKKKETVSEKVETLKTDQKTRTTALLRKDPQDVST